MNTLERYLNGERLDQEELKSLIPNCSPYNIYQDEWNNIVAYFKGRCDDEWVWSPEEVDRMNTHGEELDYFNEDLLF